MDQMGIREALETAALTAGSIGYRVRLITLDLTCELLADAVALQDDWWRDELLWRFFVQQALFCVQYGR